jgi:hypothetical protein
MKKIVFLSLLLPFVFTACKKIADSTSAITATVNGTAVTYNINSYSYHAGMGDSYYVSVLGTLAGGSDQINIVIAGNTAVTSGTTYDDFSTSDTAIIGYLSGGTGLVYQSNGTSDSAIIYVSSISAYSFHATFNGSALLLTTPGSPANYVFTNGSINVNAP